MKKFYAVIGNPPYQGENDSNGRQPPIYHYFMDEAFDVSDKVELVTPARFLFDAGQTPKAWNRKMLNDEHFKVLIYEPDATKVFPGKLIRGGVAVTLRDKSRNYGAIGTFTSYPELNSIIQKVKCVADAEARVEKWMSEVVAPRGNYRTSEKFFADFPQARDSLGKGTGNMIASNFFELVPECATEKSRPDALRFLCLINKKRTFRYINRSYVIDNPYIGTYNLAFSKSNGNGFFGEVLTLPVILDKGDCATDSFLSIGRFDTREEIDNVLAYLRTKFMRAMLSVKKVTQDNSRNVWQFVPVQNFTSVSDIDWSKPIADIDQQLYRKYGLDADEIEFIESHVKEMS